MRYVVFILLIFISCKNSHLNSDLNNVDQKYIDSICDHYDRKDLGEEKFKRLLNKSIHELRKCDDSISRYYLNRIAALSVTHNFKSSNYLVSKLNTLSLKYGDTLNYARSLRLKGSILLSKGEKLEALKFHEKSLKIFEFIESEIDLVRNYSNIGLDLYYSDDYTGAEYFLNKALKKLNNRDYSLRFKIITALILTYNGSSQSKKAIKLIKNEISQFRHEKNSIDLIILKSELAYAYEEINDFSKCYNTLVEIKNSSSFNKLKTIQRAEVNRRFLRALRKFNKGVSYEKEYEEMENQFNNEFDVGMKSSLLVDYIFHLHELGKYEKLFLKAKETYKISIKSNYIFNSLNSLILLSKVDSKNASFYFQKYDSINDLLFNSKRVNFSKILLDTNNLEKAKLKAERDRQIGIIWILIILLISIIIFIIYHKRLSKLRSDINKKNQKSNARIEELLVKNQEIEAQTRKHLLRGIAMEIHDNVLNRLASTRYQLFKLHFKQDKQTLSEAIEGIDHIQQVENELRLLTHDLTQESNSATISLLSMIQELIDIHHEVYDQEVEFTVSQWDWEQLPYNTKVNCLRIVQEALLNITKHAKATRISIQFIHESHQLIFRISDNGKGIEAVKTGLGIGLKNLEERAQMMAATIDVYSTPAEGTTLQITLPI